MDCSTKQLPYNRLVHTVLKVLRIMVTVLISGKTPGHKRDDIKLLPSSCSKKVCMT